VQRPVDFQSDNAAARRRIRASRLFLTKHKSCRAEEEVLLMETVDSSHAHAYRIQNGLAAKAHNERITEEKVLFCSLLDQLSNVLESTSNMKESMVKQLEPNINARIALRVKTLRAAQEMTLDALAAKSAVSRSMLSLVERGESSPTAVVLEKIATGLGVPLASLFDDVGAPPNPVSRASERAMWRDPQSGYERSNISPPNYPSPIQLVEVMLPAGARVAYEAAASKANIHQQIWLQEGSLELTIGSVVHKLHAGDCIAMQLEQPVTFRNRTRNPVRYIVVLSSDRDRGMRRGT
jgi:transcriptional regulator with XRE-family HTH domain